jgi:hypothetical protein
LPTRLLSFGLGPVGPARLPSVDVVGVLAVPIAAAAFSEPAAAPPRRRVGSVPSSSPRPRSAALGGGPQVVEGRAKFYIAGGDARLLIGAWARSLVGPPAASTSLSSIRGSACR